MLLKFQKVVDMSTNKSEEALLNTDLIMEIRTFPKDGICDLHFINNTVITVKYDEVVRNYIAS
jgi:hypothetical protein